MKLLKQLCEVPAPSGDEVRLTQFLLNYIEKNKRKWRSEPEIYYGPEFQDCIVLKFGKPRTAVFAHIDSVGFTVRYQNQLIPIGSPDAEGGTKLIGEDSLGPIEGELYYDQDQHAFCHFARGIDPGTSLTYKVNFRDSKHHVESAYLDNRLGVYNALMICEDLKDGVVVFSTWEEHGGGSVPFLTRFIFEKWKITQALISDITWITDGVEEGKGVVISMRDRNIPRQTYVRRIIRIAEKHRIKHQLEVEGMGSSDGREVQVSPYPIDWCFIGAAEHHAHSPAERVHKSDIESMVALYRALMKTL